jgi:hypothetical protein
MRFRMYVLSLLAFGMALCLLYHFGCIWIFKEFYICEPNTLLLTIETVLMAGIVLFSFYCIIDQIKHNE